MKFLLTSAGLSNQSITQALFALVGKPAEEITVAFIPTAANVEVGDKRWLIKDLSNFVRANVKNIDVVDIAALTKFQWLPRLQSADILCFGGGNTFYLLHWMRQSGLAKELFTLLETRVYMGISAGSIAVTQDLLLSSSFFPEDIFETPDAKQGLGFFNFLIIPHLNSPSFPNATTDAISKRAAEFSTPIYALDDQSALKISDGIISIVSEGSPLLLNTTT